VYKNILNSSRVTRLIISWVQLWKEQTASGVAVPGSRGEAAVSLAPT